MNPVYFFGSQTFSLNYPLVIMNWKQIEQDREAVSREVFTSLRAAVEEVASLIVARLKAGNKLMVCGNGGSAADAQHIAGELVNRFLQDTPPYACMALSTDTSVLTSIGNDYGYEQIFEKQVKALGKEGDVLLAITTSGNSENITRAVDAAREKGITTVGLLGGTGGEVKDKVDQLLLVSAAAVTPRIQEGHHLIYHLLCELIEEQLA